MKNFIIHNLKHTTQNSQLVTRNQKLITHNSKLATRNFKLLIIFLAGWMIVGCATPNDWGLITPDNLERNGFIIMEARVKHYGSEEPLAALTLRNVDKRGSSKGFDLYDGERICRMVEPGRYRLMVDRMDIGVDYENAITIKKMSEIFEIKAGEIVYPGTLYLEVHKPAFTERLLDPNSLVSSFTAEATSLIGFSVSVDGGIIDNRQEIEDELEERTLPAGLKFRVHLLKGFEKSPVFLWSSVKEKE